MNISRSKLKILLVSFGIILLVNIFLFTPSAYASFLDTLLDPIGNFKKGLREWFSELATSFASAAFEYMGDFIISQSNTGKIPNIKTLVSWSQWAAGSLVTFFLLKRVVEGLRDNLTGESEPNFAEIIGSAALSMAMIFATPKIVYMFIDINNAVVQGLTTSLGIDVNIAGNEFIDKFTLGGDLALASLHLLFMVLVWAIALIVFAIVGALRYVELGFILVMGPISASTYTNRSGVLQTYWTEAIAVIFTQVAHVLLAYWIIQWSSNGDVWGLVSALASAFISLKGPQILRQFLYSSGTGGMVSGTSRFAVYKAMAPKIK